MKAVHYAIILGLICIAAAFGVAGTFRMTKDRIQAKTAAEANAARNAVVASDGGAEIAFEGLNAREGVPEIHRVFRAKQAGGDTVLGYTAAGEAQGYGGKIRVMVGMDAQAEKILAVKVVVQSETPGLGTQVAEIKSRKTWVRLVTGKGGDVEDPKTSEFLMRFEKKVPPELAFGDTPEDIQAITGATISSTAVLAATRRAVAKILLAARPRGDLAAQFRKELGNDVKPEWFETDAPARISE